MLIIFTLLIYLLMNLINPLLLNFWSIWFSNSLLSLIYVSDWFDQSLHWFLYWLILLVRLLIFFSFLYIFLLIDFILFVDDPILLCRYPGVCPGLQVQEESCLAPRGQPGRGKLNQSFLSWSGSLFSGFLYSDAVPVFNAFLYLDPYSMAFCTRIRIRNTDPGTWKMSTSLEH